MGSSANTEAMTRLNHQNGGVSVIRGCERHRVRPRAIDEAITWLEKANADLEPELLGASATRDMLAAYARAEKLVSFGKAVLAQRLDNAA